MTAVMQEQLEEVRAAFETHRAEVLQSLREYAKTLAEREGSVSVNDLRDYFATLGYQGDPRILGSVFRCKDGWMPVGAELGNSENSHPGHTVRRWRRV